MKIPSAIFVTLITMFIACMAVLDERKKAMVDDLSEMGITTNKISSTPFTTCENKWGRAIYYELIISKNDGPTITVIVCRDRYGRPIIKEKE